MHHNPMKRNPVFLFVLILTNNCGVPGIYILLPLLAGLSLTPAVTNVKYSVQLLVSAEVVSSILT